MILQGLDPSSQSNVVQNFVNQQVMQEEEKMVEKTHRVTIQVTSFNVKGKVPRDY